MKLGQELITEERNKQIDQEGWDAEHDDEHDCGELAMAAICYASPEPIYRKSDRLDAIYFIDPWPWGDRDDKRQRKDSYLLWNMKLPIKERVRNLVKAGALIAAEIDRLQRI